jgi:hypothetical protein
MPVAPEPAAPRAHFRLPGGVGFCNAVRRTLLSDVVAWAPHSLTVRVNTSCVTDEYLAHRIGLVPFARTGNGETLTLRSDGPCTAVASDLTGPGFSPVYPGVPLLELGEGQALDLDVHLDRQPARKHARYAACSAVGLEGVSDDGDAMRLSFASNDERTPAALLAEALGHLDARVDRALLALANQPSQPPQSFC